MLRNVQLKNSSNLDSTLDQEARRGLSFTVTCTVLPSSSYATFDALPRKVSRVRIPLKSRLVLLRCLPGLLHQRLGVLVRVYRKGSTFSLCHIFCPFSCRFRATSIPYFTEVYVFKATKKRASRATERVTFRLFSKTCLSHGSVRLAPRPLIPRLRRAFRLRTPCAWRPLPVL